MTTRPWLKPLLSMLAVLMGVGSAAQSRINGELAVETGGGTFAAAISFGTGLVILLVVAVFRKEARDGTRRIVTAVRRGDLPWWGLLGGLCGSAFVLAQGVTVPLLGVAVFMTSMVVGQLAGSLAIDHFGWLGAPRQRISWLRNIGAAVAFVAVAIVGFAGGVEVEHIGAMLFGVGAGFLLSLQLGITGTVRMHARESFGPTIVNFVVGFAILLLVAVLSLGAGWYSFEGFPATWWLYLGGPIGIVYIVLVASVVRGLGVFVLSLSLLGGQLLGSLLFDLLEGRVNVLLVSGVVLAFVGIALAQLGARKA